MVEFFLIVKDFFDYLLDSTETISCYIFTMQYEILYSKNVYLRIT